MLIDIIMIINRYIIILINKVMEWLRNWLKVIGKILVISIWKI